MSTLAVVPKACPADHPVDGGPLIAKEKRPGRNGRARRFFLVICADCGRVGGLAVDRDDAISHWNRQVRDALRYRGAA